MSPKNYTVKAMVKATFEDETEIAKILAMHPLWKRKDARDLLARRRFAQKIR